MRILQLDVDSLTYELVKPESKVYEESSEKAVTVKDALVLFITVENGDGAEIAKQAVVEAVDFMNKVGRKELLIYPFAHLSNDLAEPREAMKIIDQMYQNVPKGISAKKAPFGWNKKLSMSVKGYPLAEQSRSYGKGKVEKKMHAEAPRQMDTSIVKKSDWSGLPENDHRTIGEKLDLYSFQEVSPGMTYWHPNGYVIYKELFKYIREKLEEYNYQEIATPAFANSVLWHVSGHFDHYKENMYFFEVEGQQYGLKPMNCPSTFLIFKSKKWSYRDFPVRFADFDKLYRNEVSGALTGLFRVREVTQDDAHIFVREDQVEEELTTVIKMVLELYAKFGLSYIAKLSTMPDSHLGEEDKWKHATEALLNAIKKNGVKYELKKGEGAFYGPKIDFDILDSQGRAWQCATVQLDYQLPARFKLEYTGEDGKQHAPVVIHRVIYGSLERFIGVLTEHYLGKFPTWIAPTQVKVMAISDKTNDYAEKIFAELKQHKIRVVLDTGDRTINYKVRGAIEEKIPYMLILGEKEKESGLVTVRNRAGKQTQLKLKDVISKLKEEIEGRSNAQLL